ncbi:MAG: hypothetical protein ACRYE9_04425 [Janthinobacterium lividum]
MIKLTTINYDNKETFSVKRVRSTVPSFITIIDRLLTKFKSIKSGHKAREILNFVSNYAIIVVSKSNLPKPTTSKVKTIDEVGELLDEKAVLAYRQQWLENNRLSSHSEQEAFCSSNSIPDKQINYKSKFMSKVNVESKNLISKNQDLKFDYLPRFTIVAIESDDDEAIDRELISKANKWSITIPYYNGEIDFVLLKIESVNMIP